MFRDTFLAEDSLLSAADVHRLIVMRAAYDYPRARMEVSYSPTPFPLAKDVWAQPIQPGRAITDYALDEYHRGLLIDPSPVNNLLGTVSVVYWGFYTWSPAIATIRAERHLHGFRSKSGTSPSAIADALAAMDVASDMGRALGALKGISQLGRTPFGSKVVTQRHPELSGVFDTQLYRALSRFTWAHGAAFLRIGSVADARCVAAFLAWCEFLCRLAVQLNAGIDAGNPWHWRDVDGTLRRWRPVDAERAIFKYCLLEKNNPQALAHHLAMSSTDFHGGQ
jgi:hypothetical protein